MGKSKNSQKKAAKKKNQQNSAAGNAQSSGQGGTVNTIGMLQAAADAASLDKTSFDGHEVNMMGS